MVIGYVAQKFPQLTLTFVYRELLALRAAGVHVETFSIWKPALSELSEESRSLVKSTFYIFPLNGLQFGWSHLFYLVTRPRRYVTTLWFCLTRKHKSFKNRLRTLVHFAQAIHLAKAVKARGVQHLHAHFALNATTLALVVSRMTDVPFSFTAHANDIFVNPILLPEKIAAARFIVAISDFNARFLYDVAPTSETAQKLHVVRYGIDVRQYAPVHREDQNHPLTILGVARLVEKKGFPYLIKACRRLAERGYDFRCVIVGGGPQAALLRHMIDEYQLADRVQLAGVIFQEQLKDYFGAADVFVLPCIVGTDRDMDGIPNTLMEAMAMEISVISTGISGIPELIEDGRTGLLVPPEDEVALAGALADLLDHPERRLALGKSGRAKVTAEFETEKNARALLALFESYLPSEMKSPVAPQTLKGAALERSHD